MQLEGRTDMHLGKLSQVRLIAEIFSHLGHMEIRGNALILMATVNRSYRHAVVSKFIHILSIIEKGEPRLDHLRLKI